MSADTGLPDGFESVSCEICGQDSRRIVASRKDLFLGGDACFFMYECLGCGSVYQYPRPTEGKMTDFYPADYQQYTAGVHTERRLARFFRRYGLRKRCQFVMRYVTHGRLLDVGCATGDFLSEMQLQPEWQVVGIEPGHTAVVYAKQEVGVDAVEGVLNEAPFAKQSFAAITMWDVLEHVYNPRMVIQQAANLLRPGGILVVNHPNLDSIDRRIFGDLWLGYELPRHLYLFPANLLSRLMAEEGLDEIGQECLYGSHAATISSLMFKIEEKFGDGRFSRIMRKILFSRVMRLLLVPNFKIIEHYRLGSNITAVFQKQHEPEENRK